MLIHFVQTSNVDSNITSGIENIFHFKMTSATDEKIPIYIVNVHPMLIQNSLCWDIYYLREDSRDIYCLRIFNIQLSFMVARLPGLSLDQFKRYMNMYVSDMRTEIRTDLVDASYYSFSDNREYMEIFSSNPRTLYSIYDKLNKSLPSFYARINPERLNVDDQLFYKNTETPFRFTSTTTSLPNSVYNLSTKYGIPLIGGAMLNLKYVTNKYPTEDEPLLSSGHIHGLNAQETKAWDAFTVNKRIRDAIVPDETIDFKQNMTLLAYDIETYNPDGDLDPLIPDYYIFAIGIGVFNFTSATPFKRICILMKNFDSDPLNPETNEPLPFKRGKDFGRSTITVKGEYDPSNPNDETEYIITRNERDLLCAFIDVLAKYKAQVVTGFNSFAFDDNYVYRRMEKWNLETELLQQYTYYDITSEETTLPKQSWFKPFMPTFRKFELKIDGEIWRDNDSIRAWSVLNVDVRKLMLKEDPKRFTQYGRGNLDTMLEVYGIKNPYSKKQLSKTGLKIHEMYRRWEENENIYSIGLYCCQDAWITGTLLIERAKLIDLIEMSGITNTMFADSIYKADGIRVANSILGYAYKEDFALMDSPFIQRKEALDHKPVQGLGGKQFDERTIVGAAVRNVHAGRLWFVVALDYSSMYPSGKEASNLDSSSRVDEEIIKNPERYGLIIVKKLVINDMYGKREIYYMKKLNSKAQTKNDVEQKCRAKTSLM